MAEPEFLKDKVKTEVDTAISEANTAPSNTQVTDSDVAEERKKAGNAIADTIDKAGENTAHQMDSENVGAAGKNVSALMKRITGKVKPATFGSNLRYYTDVPADRKISVSDADHLERNTAMAEAAFDQVHSNIVREATRATENSEQAVIGVPSDVNVYSEESFTPTETVVGKLSLYPESHPKAREHGTLIARSQRALSISGDYLHRSEGNAADAGHDGKKGWGQYQNLLLNRLDRNGAVIPKQFIAPKRGRFWVRGFSPLPANASPLAKIGVVSRKEYARGTDGSVTERWTDCDVYQAPSSSQGLFDVVDVTTTMDDMANALAETAELITCNKSKFSLGQFEQISQMFAQAQRVVDDPSQVIEWPEFADAQRSTLNSAAGVSNLGSVLDCNNTMECVVEFMHYLQESEVISLVARLDAAHMKDTLKFHKGQEGQNSEYPYWRKVFHGDPAEAGVFSAPTMASYASTKASAARYNTFSKWVYSFRSFWSDLDSYCAVLDEGIVKDTLMSKIKVQKDVIDRLHNMLGLGVINDKDEMTSNQIIYGANSVDLILAFDPNDLIDYVTTGLSNPQTASIAAFPCAGYANVFTRTSAMNAQTVVYKVLPTWEQILLEAVSAAPFRQRVVQHVPSGVQRPDAIVADFFAGGGYAPINIDLMIPSWFSMYYLEAVMCYKERVFSPRNQVSAYLRFMRAEEVFGVDSVLSNDLVDLASAMSGLVTDEVTYLNATWTKPSDFPELHDGAIKENFGYMSLQPLATMQIEKLQLAEDNWGLGVKDTFRGDDGAIILQPNRLDSYVYNMRGYRVLNPVDGVPAEFDTLEDVMYLTGELNAILTPGEQVTKPSLEFRYSSDGQDGYLAYVGGGPVLFQRDVKRNGGRTVEMCQFDADAGLIGYEENPDKTMYFDDSFDNLPPFDGFMLLRHSGNYIDIQQEDKHLPAFARCSFAPYIACQIGNDSATITPHAQNVTIALLSGATGNTQPHGPDHDANAIFTVTGTGDQAVYTLVTSRMADRQNGAIAIMSRPSLYGYERTVVGGITQIQVGATSDGFVCKRRELPVDGIGFTPDGSNSLRLYELYGWAPNVLDDGVDVSFDALQNEQGTRFAVDSISASNWTWYSKQNVITYDGGFAGISPENIGDGVQYLVLDGYLDVLERCHYAANICLLTTNPLSEADFVNGWVGYATSITKIGNVEGQVYPATAAFGRDLSLEDADALFEYFARYEHKALMAYFASPVFVPGKNATGTGTNKQTVQIIFGYPLDATRNPATRTRRYRNDLRAFLTDKPVVRLNRNWNAYGMTAPLFYEQFHVNMR